ncbi:hypothetical protein SAMN05444362_104184 [Dysgonomonas macrotermitis]|uniref:Uncharacterized protein n=1 Tax=Dysgonomonas macrotermitis TaxID=1346286 RepID=A0A1M4ZTG1_9BACT|nr:hypothetical protein SAMN05444362_104184 [Dysgonomonas macrotermitis]
MISNSILVIAKSVPKYNTDKSSVGLFPIQSIQKGDTRVTFVTLLNHYKSANCPQKSDIRDKYCIFLFSFYCLSIGFIYR